MPYTLMPYTLMPDLIRIYIYLLLSTVLFAGKTCPPYSSKDIMIIVDNKVSDASTKVNIEPNTIHVDCSINYNCLAYFVPNTLIPGSLR